MTRHILTAIGLAFVMTAPTAALAIDTPTNKDDCLQISFDLAQKAREMGKSEEELQELEPLFEKAELSCDAGRFDEAVEAMQEIEERVGQ